jgi:hypothetical protein
MAFKTLKPMKMRFLWCGYRWPLSASEVAAAPSTILDKGNLTSI